MFTKFFGVTNRNKFLNELEKVLKEKFADKEDIDKIISSIGQADGIASLDDSGKVPSEQLPSYVDDIIEVEDYAHLPEEGETGKIYVTLDTGNQYRWGGSEYVPLNENSVQGIGIKKIIKLTQAEYDALSEKDSEAIYITNAPQALANGVYILYTDGSLSNYDTLDSDKTPVGPVLKKDNVCIVINPKRSARNKSTSGAILGATTTKIKNEALADYSGIANTQAFISSGLSINALSVITSDAFAFTDGRARYIPAAGEFNEIISNKTQINAALTLISDKIGNTYTIGDTGRPMFTSTLYDDNTEWAFSTSFVLNDVSRYMECEVRSVSTYTPPIIYKLYQGNNLIASSEDINRISTLEDKVTSIEQQLDGVETLLASI